MQKAMNITWNHVTSTDDNPKNQRCGDWCFWVQYCKIKKQEYMENKDEYEKENKENERLNSPSFYKKNPFPSYKSKLKKPSHDSMNVRIIYKEGLAHYKKCKAIWDSLICRELLERCEGHHTQNVNESFNNLIYKICPKKWFFAFPTYRFAICQSILNSQLGYELGNILKFFFNIESTIGMKSLWRAQEYSRKKTLVKRTRRNLKDFSPVMDKKPMKDATFPVFFKKTAIRKKIKSRIKVVPKII